MNARSTFPAPHVAPQALLDEPSDITGAVILDASNIDAFWSFMGASPVRLGPPAPKRSYDWSKSKEQNLADAMAEVDRAFAPRAGR